MRQKRTSQRRSHSSDSSSDSEGASDEAQISPDLYQQLGTAPALRRAADYASAVSELAELARHLFKRCSKVLQGQIVQDMMLAIECCDGRLQSRAALAKLMEAAERALPQAKRAALQRAYRDSGVALSRRQRRAGGTAGSDSDEDEPASFSHLPLDAVRQVFRHLDPITLARSACVCREWQAAAADDSLWYLHCERLQGRAAAEAAGRGRAAAAAGGGQTAAAAAPPSAAKSGASSAGAAAAAAATSASQAATAHTSSTSCSSSCRQQFAAAVRQRPERLLRWRTNRIVLAGRKLGWLDPARPPAGSWRHVGTAAVLAFLRSGGRSVRAGGTSNSSGGSSDSSGDEQGISQRLRFWQL